MSLHCASLIEYSMGGDDQGGNVIRRSTDSYDEGLENRAYRWRSDPVLAERRRRSDLRRDGHRPAQRRA